jgi:hypothetical protein
MADEADMSDERIALTVQAAIEQARRAPALRARGCCHYCDEPVPAPLLFCDKTCAEDFDAEEQQLKRMGRR